MCLLPALQRLRSSSGKDLSWHQSKRHLQAPVELVAQTYVTSASYDIVLNSTGAVLALVDEVVEQSKVWDLSTVLVM